MRNIWNEKSAPEEEKEKQYSVAPLCITNLYKLAEKIYDFLCEKGIYFCVEIDYTKYKWFNQGRFVGVKVRLSFFITELVKTLYYNMQTVKNVRR